MKNIEKYKKDLEQLVSNGDKLYVAMLFECYPEKLIKYKKSNPDKVKDLINFKDRYQDWYSESLVIIKVLLPDRLHNFISLYERPQSRKEITHENYVIEDYLKNLRVTRGYNKELVVGPDSAIHQFEQQVNILRSAQKRFVSSLFDIKGILQADLYDSELDAALELNKKGFMRGAGAMAGVVLEGHLSQVCENHVIKLSKKKLTISDLNDLLKSNDVIQLHDWRFIQRLADLRNLCDHQKDLEPTKDHVKELIDGVQKIIKIIF